MVAAAVILFFAWKVPCTETKYLLLELGDKKSGIFDGPNPVGKPNADFNLMDEAKMYNMSSLMRDFKPKVNAGLMDEATMYNMGSLMRDFKSIPKSLNSAGKKSRNVDRTCGNEN